jgi:hypothetical protein
MRGTRKLGLAALVAILALSIAAAPASAITKREKKQNRSLRALNKRTKATDKRLKTLSGDLGKLTADVATAKNGLAAIQAAVPTVVSSLTTLGDAAKQLKAGLEAAGAGITQLKTGLETLAAKTTDGFDEVATNLTTIGTGLQDLATASNKFIAGAEYGFVQLYFDPEGDGFEANDAVPGALLVSADVPDDTNQSTVTGKLMLRVPDQTTAKPVALKSALRSGEKDGTGAANPAGVAGLMAMSATMIGAPGTTSIGGGNPGTNGTLPLTSAPNGALGGLPVYPIADKAARAGANPTVFPDAQSIDLTNPATLQSLTGAPARFTVTNTSGADAAALFDVTVRFNDLTPVDPDNLDE